MDAWLSRCKLPVKSRRVYRWDDIWGFLTDSGLQCVKRNFIADTTDGATHYNLESQSLYDASVPLLCDDIWEEEYVEHTRGTCNGLLTVTGTLKDIQMWCKTAHILVPESLWMGISSKTDDSLKESPQSQPPPSQLPRPYHLQTPHRTQQPPYRSQQTQRKPHEGHRAGHQGGYPQTQSRPHVQHRPSQYAGSNRGRPFVHRSNPGVPPAGVVEHV